MPDHRVQRAPSGPGPIEEPPSETPDNPSESPVKEPPAERPDQPPDSPVKEPGAQRSRHRRFVTMH